jgi:hypothetical protein
MIKAAKFSEMLSFAARTAATHNQCKTKQLNHKQPVLLKTPTKKKKKKDAYLI